MSNTKKYTIAIIEDDEWFSESIKYYLELNEDHTIQTFSNAKDFFSSSIKPDVVCVDYHLPDLKGDKVIIKLLEKNQKTPIIVVSAQEDMQTTLNILKLGVKDYIIKSEHSKELIWKAIEEIKENQQLKDTIQTLEKKLAEHTQPQKVNMIGNHPSMKKITTLIQKAAESNINVSITGETGTGKEVVAQQIHNISDRKNQLFVAVNMAAIPADLIESELFGYEKGAFTGAAKKTKGKFELANGGTLFLDEIAELDLHLQSKILRALQEKEITPLGSEKPIKLDIRLIVATHQNLSQLVQEGKFREDLFYRLLGLPISLPNLSERGNDVLLLSQHFINEFCKENQKNEKALSKEAREKLINYQFPGNIRELKAIIDLACVLSEDSEIKEEDIHFNSTKKKTEFLDENLTLKEFTDQYILYNLEKNHQNVQQTAAKLGIGKSTIYNLLNSNNESSNL